MELDFGTGSVQFGSPTRRDPPAQQIGESEQIAAGPPAPVDPGFRHDDLHEIGRDVPAHLGAGAARGAGAFAPHVNWIGDLRIAEPLSSDEARICSHVKAPPRGTRKRGVSGKRVYS